MISSSRDTPILFEEKCLSQGFECVNCFVAEPSFLHIICDKGLLFIPYPESHNPEKVPPEQRLWCIMRVGLKRQGIHTRLKRHGSLLI